MNIMSLLNALPGAVAQGLILLVAEFGCFVLIFMGALIADAAERFSGWVAGL